MTGLSVLTLGALVLYVLVLRRLNVGGFVLSPAGIQTVYLAFYLVIPAVALYESGLPHLLSEPVYISARVLTAAILGLISCLVGACIAGRRKARSAVLQNNLKGNRFILYLVLTGAITAAFLLMNWGSLSAINDWQSLLDPDRYALVQEFKVATLNGSNYLLQGANQIIPFIVLFYFGKYFCGERKAYFLAAVLLLAVNTIFLFSIGALWVAFAPFIMVLMLRQYFRPANLRQIALAGLLLASIVVGSMILKHGAMSVEGADEDLQSSPIIGLIGQRFASGAATLQVAFDTFPSVASYEYGTSYVRDFVGLIPSPLKHRILPPDWWGGFNGYFFGLIYGFPGGTTQIPIMGEFYANFGFVGIPICCVLYGFCLQSLSNILREHSIKQLSSLVIVTVLAYRLAEATVEGIGDRFMVSCVWAMAFQLTYAWRPIWRSLNFGRARPHLAPKQSQPIRVGLAATSQEKV
jgi:oligosaccharide repeat unit polymerase